MSLLSFLAYCVIATFTPGPTNIAILSIAHRVRIKESFQYMYGATIAFGMLLAASALFNQAMVAVVPNIIDVMQVIGCLYMLYLAYQVFTMKLSEDTAAQVATFKSGYIMQFVNPKTWLFTMTVIPSYVMPYYNSPGALTLFVLGITIIAFLAFTTWAMFGLVFKQFFQRHQKAVNIVLAFLLVYSAIEVSGLLK
ncbi:transporter, LysE family [Niallia circulans]|uniref:LysE family translocator n=1 Tax=Shouchella clausii TaxID=79880 RepID=UPI000BA7005C|nr:LysE family transporter [Shouchella clausii]PAF14311.1 lysine transporter LysE [Shouchella clausii]SPU21422.1 transporter, LysE family [Niallia circulans]